MNEVLCIGLIVTDVVVKPFCKLPQKGKLELVNDVQLHTGGCALNTAVALDKLGIKTGLIGRIGKGGFGEFILKKIKETNIDYSGVIIDEEESTSTTIVLVSEDGERSFLHLIGANKNLSEEDVRLSIMKEYKIIHIGGSFLAPKFEGVPLANILKKAKNVGLMTSLDTAWDSSGKWLNLLEPSLPYVDIIIPSYEEAKMIAGIEEPEKIADFFLSFGIRIAAIKMAEKGCFIKSKEEVVEVPAFKVDVMDSTGAGDSFVSGFLAAYLKGWNLREIGLFANAVGAFCVSAIGSSTGIKDFNETVNFIKNNR